MDEMEGVDLYSILGRTVALHGDREAVIFSNLRLTYRDLAERVERVAGVLWSMGIGPGDRVGLLAPNRPAYLELLLACAKLGAILVPFNTRYGVTDLRGAIQRSAPRVIFAAEKARSQDLRGVLASALGCPPEGLIRLDTNSELEQVIFLDPGDGSSPAPGHLLESPASTPCSGVLPTAVQRSESVLLLLFTSGSSGAPKPVMLGQRELATNMRSIVDRQGLVASDRFLSFLPFFHLFGGVIGTLTPVICGGVHVMMESFDAAASLAMVEAERCTVVMGVAPTYQAWFEHESFERIDLSSLRTGFCNAGKGPMARMTKRVRSRLAPTHSVFAMTETSGAVTMTWGSEDETRASESAGVPLPGFEIGIFDPLTSTQLAAGALGEIRIRGDLLFRGYFRMAEESARSFQNGWFRTGDRGRVDDQGYLFVDGRLDERIRSGGENIDPKEVEDFIESLSGIRRCYVVGVPDDRLQQVPVAFVIPEDAATSIPEAEVIAACRGGIASFKIPRRVFCIDEAPGWLHKVQKHRLREDAIELMGLAST
jgi:fatty-acyl-CoA synthase